MAFDDLNYWISEDELENSIDFKLFKKIVLQKYDWIIDIIIPEPKELNEYTIIFFKLVVNPYILSKKFDSPLRKYTKYYILNNEYYEYPNMTIIFSPDDDIKSKIKLFEEKIKRDFNDIKDIISKNLDNQSNSRLKGRDYSFFEIIIPPSSVIPIPEGVEWSQN